MLEVSAGVFIGRVSARIREELWERVKGTAGSGRAILIWSAKNEQRLNFDVHEHHWDTVDLDGVTLMRRPSSNRNPKASSQRRSGWSIAGSARRAKRFGR
ncbi:type I-E CRISPR-associated endoribonuclease Cas2e [Kocuria sp.]|uniref:type I-E CRISPR-associated endoribonuclease Cas2e n=1 Tax=Kocuria sp. TaxID=1871328 RepID=UPI0026DFC604|nr:type I-E CRISPR-associated endoribonuclease Cas2e [Kocuria sp.]